MNSIAKSKIIASIISVIFGVLLIIFQGSAIDTAVMVMGILSLVAAVAVVIMFFVQKGSPLAFVLVAILLVIGIIFIVRPRIFSNILPLFFGLFLIASGILNMTQLMLFPEKSFHWIMSLILSILVVVFGVVILFHMNSALNGIALWIGIAYLISGVSDLIFFLFYKNQN